MRFLLIFLFSSLVALPSQSQGSEKDAIVQPIKELFDGMRLGDSMAVAGLFVSGAQLSSVVTDRNGRVVKRSTPIPAFVTAVGSPRTEVWDEIIWSYDVRRDGPLAIVWTEYSFYRGDQFSHCGVNVFEMMSTNDGWKISGITDTRRNTDCRRAPEEAIGELLDHWHAAAAEADEDVFFGSMTRDAVYLGTDAGERWLRDELKEWSKDFFSGDSAWSFTPGAREIMVSEDGKTAWFDELLETWMGPCRGSGVLVMEGASWKIKHYHLSIAVPNDAIDGYLQLIGVTKK